VAAGVASWPGASGGPGPVVAVGVVYAVERLATEWWKAIWREDDQLAYTIPMRLGFRGRPVDDPLLRYTVGALVAAGVIAAMLVTDAVQGLLPGLPPWLVVPVVGGIGGWATACGGAWKDAPVEGFSGWKFLRSPVVATAWAVPLSVLTDSWVLLPLAAGGLAVASIETYKTFLTGGRPPGKFATRPVRFCYPRMRRLLPAAHALLWAVFAVVAVTTVAAPMHGLAVPELGALSPELPETLLYAVAAVACALAVLVGTRRREHVR
ncbi:MAG: hypothetical protein ACRDO8_01335, partial [Nocardioidaceae bacterium]